MGPNCNCELKMQLNGEQVHVLICLHIVWVCKLKPKGHVICSIISIMALIRQTGHVCSPSEVIIILHLSMLPLASQLLRQGRSSFVSGLFAICVCVRAAPLTSASLPLCCCVFVTWIGWENSFLPFFLFATSITFTTIHTKRIHFLVNILKVLTRTVNWIHMNVFVISLKVKVEEQREISNQLWTWLHFNRLMKVL